MDSTTVTWHVSPDGNAHAEGTLATPLRTVEQALARLDASPRPAQIVLLPGLYPPFSLQGVRGAPTQPVVIRGMQSPSVDYSVASGLDNRMEWQPARQALDGGAWQLRDPSGLAVIVGDGEDGVQLSDCADIRLEGLVFYNGAVVVSVRRCRRAAIVDCVVTGEPARAGAGITFRIDGPDDDPSREIRLERVLAYNLKECGFIVEPGALFDSRWECCIAHGMQSLGGDGFSFLHVLPTDKPGAHPNRVFAGGIDYGISLYRCLALRNRLDGFDIGQGVGGVTLDTCLGDGNGWGEWYAKDLKVWSGNNRLICCRMTGRTLFVEGTTEMRDFKAGTFDIRVGYNPVSGEAFASRLRPVLDSRERFESE